MRAIAMIAMKEGINQKDLAFLLGIRPQTMGEILRKLEDRGLVERKKSEADGRAIEVYLTDEEKEQLGTILGKLEVELDKHSPHGRHKGDEKPIQA